MHPGSAKLLLKHQATARARARGRCEACGASAPEATPISPIDGLPQPEDLIVACEACRPAVMAELATASTVTEYRVLIEAMRARGSR